MAAHTQPRRSSATPKRAEQMEENPAPPLAAPPPAQHIADEAQQDEMQMDSPQGGAVAGSPAGEILGRQAGHGRGSDVHDHEAPRTLASRISRFAGIFTGRRNAPDTPTGGCSSFDGTHSDCICFCDDSTQILFTAVGSFCRQDLISCKLSLQTQNLKELLMLWRVCWLHKAEHWQDSMCGPIVFGARDYSILCT